MPRGPCWRRCAPWWPQGEWPHLPLQLPPQRLCLAWPLPRTHQASRKAAVLTFLPASSFERTGSLSPGQDWWTFGGQYAGLCFKPLYPPIIRFTLEGDPSLLFPIPTHPHVSRTLSDTSSEVEGDNLPSLFPDRAHTSPGQPAPLSLMARVRCVERSFLGTLPQGARGPGTGPATCFLRKAECPDLQEGCQGE